MRYAVVDRATKTVVNVIEAPDDWVMGDGYRLVKSATAGTGDSYDASTRRFTPAVRPPPATSPREEYEVATTTAGKLAVIAKHVGLAG